MTETQATLLALAVELVVLGPSILRVLRRHGPWRPGTPVPSPGVVTVEVAREFRSDLDFVGTALGRLLVRLLRLVARARLANAGAAGLLFLATLAAPARLRATLVASWTDIEDEPPGWPRVRFALRALLSTVLDRLGGAPGAAGTPGNERVVDHGGRRVTVVIEREGGVRVDYED